MKKTILIAAVLSLAWSSLFAQYGQSSSFGQSSIDAGPRPFYEATADPYAGSANIGWVYTKDVSGSTELYYQNDSSTVSQITDEGSLFATFLNDMVVSPTAATSGAHTAFTVTGAANTGITASTEAPVVKITPGTQTWATGAVTQQRFARWTQPTIGAAAASAFTIAATSAIDAPPTQGTNVTLSIAAGLLIGDPFTQRTVKVDTGGSIYGITTEVFSIASGVGDVNELFGINISEGAGSVSLGNQTANLSEFAGLDVGALSLVSTTNTRTVTNASGAIFNAPTAGANVTFSFPANAIWAKSGRARLDGGVILGSTQTLLSTYKEGTFTPSFTNLTVVDGTGGATYTGFYTRTGDTVFWQVHITTTGTCTTASTAGSTYFTGLQAAAGNQARASTLTATTSSQSFSGVGVLGNEAVMPSWTASADDIYISGTYKVN